MTTITKSLLTISVTAFALGCTGIFWGLGTPVGAICLGLFLISKLLEKEQALFDQEQRERFARADAYHPPTTSEVQFAAAHAAAAKAH